MITLAIPILDYNQPEAADETDSPGLDCLGVSHSPSCREESRRPRTSQGTMHFKSRGL